MNPPKNIKEVRALIGIFNYYSDMWSNRSHILHPLTELTSHKAKFKWIDVEQKAFDDIKRAVSQDTLLACPDFNKQFDIHKDDRDYQLVAVISQNNKPIAFNRSKLTGPQTQYTVTEKELPSIVEILKEI